MKWNEIKENEREENVKEKSDNYNGAQSFHCYRFPPFFFHENFIMYS